MQTVNLTAIVNDALSAGYYNYRGSLTTPTCDESVTWNVFKTKLNVTEAQVVRIELAFLSTPITLHEKCPYSEFS